MKIVVAETFVEMHTEEHRSQSIPEECPCCEISKQEVTYAFQKQVTEDVKPIVEQFSKEWDALGYAIGNKGYGTQMMTGVIVDTILRYVKPPVPYEEFLPEDIYHHPYVQEKYRELKDK